LAVGWGLLALGAWRYFLADQHRPRLTAGVIIMMMLVIGKTLWLI